MYFGFGSNFTPQGTFAIWNEMHLFTIKGELQHQNKLISSERPFIFLQNETKIIKIREAVLKIFNF